MAGIQRFFTYIYIYEDDSKKKNVGFAKVDVRGDYGQVEIHLKRTGFTKTQCPVYFFTREENNMIGVKLGEMAFINGSGDFGTRFNSKNIRSSNYSMREMKGLLMPLNEKIMFASQWDEKEILRENFKEYDERNTKEVKEKMSLSENKPDMEKKEEDKQGVEIETEELKEIPVQRAETKRSVQTDSLHQENEAEQIEKIGREIKEGERQNELQEYWERLVEQYEEIQPFEEDDEILGVKIELKDLRELPQPFSYLASNSFLMHGFFNYRHLLLGRIQKGNEEKWFIGVPGVFENPERILAAIFGFPEFRQEKNTPAKTNQFGYWYRIMDE